MKDSYDYDEAAIRALVRVDSLAIDSTIDVMPVVRGRVARLVNVVLKSPPPSARDASTIGVEAIAGSDRVVTRSSSGQIVAVEWKNPGNVIITINVESPGGIDSSTAASLIQHLG